MQWKDDKRFERAVCDYLTLGRWAHKGFAA
jgi:hypothetical protein